MAEIVIEALQPGEIQDATEVAGRAMAPTPFPMAIFGEGKKAEQGMKAIFKIMFRRWPGKVFVAKEDSRVIGVMRMVEWPRCQMTPLQGVLLTPTMITMGLATSLRGMKGRAIWSKHDPKEHHWHLDPLTVMPERQGQGIGSQLLKYFCDHVDKMRRAAYLETDRVENVRLYERFGWQVKEEATVIGVHCWFMWRAASGKES